MFACPLLESELLGRIEALAARPLAELLLQQGILRTMAQEILLRDLREAVTFTAKEEPVILSRLWEGVEGPPPTSLAGDWIANLPEPLRLGMGQRWDQVRLQKLIETRYTDRLEPYFLERRKDLEQVVYGLIRLRNQGAAEELYLRLLDDGADFTELARHHSVGEERFTHGLVGPMLITQPHPTIRAVLESLKVGDVHAPFRVEQWVLLVRMEHRQPASLNDVTRIQLMQELLQQELDETLDAMLAAFYPTLVPTDGAIPTAALPASVEVAGQKEESLQVEESVEEEVHVEVELMGEKERELDLAVVPVDEACAEAKSHETIETASESEVSPVATGVSQKEIQAEAEPPLVVASLAGFAEASSSREQEKPKTEPKAASTVEADVEPIAEILPIAAAPPREIDPWEEMVPMEAVVPDQPHGPAETAAIADTPVLEEARPALAVEEETAPILAADAAVSTVNKMDAEEAALLKDDALTISESSKPEEAFTIAEANTLHEATLPSAPEAPVETRNHEEVVATDEVASEQPAAAEGTIEPGEYAVADTVSIDEVSPNVVVPIEADTSSAVANLAVEPMHAITEKQETAEPQTAEPSEQDRAPADLPELDAMTAEIDLSPANEDPQIVVDVLAAEAASVTESPLLEYKNLIVYPLPQTINRDQNEQRALSEDLPDAAIAVPREAAVMTDSVATVHDPLTGNALAADNVLAAGDVMVTSEVMANVEDPQPTQIVLAAGPVRAISKPSLNDDLMQASLPPVVEVSAEAEIAVQPDLPPDPNIPTPAAAPLGFHNSASNEDPVTGELAAEVNSLVIKEDRSATSNPLVIEAQNDSESCSGEVVHQENEVSLSAEPPVDTDGLSVPDPPSMIESLAAGGIKPLEIGEISAAPIPPQAPVPEDPWTTESPSNASAPFSAG